MERNQTSGCSFRIGKCNGINRCACGNTYEFSCVARSFDDGTQEHVIYCKECKRSITVPGELSDCVQAFNEMNHGAIPLRFHVESVPEIITIYSKTESDVNVLLEKELKERTKIRRLTETDFRTYSKRLHYIKSADIVINDYAFSRQGNIVTVISLRKVTDNSTEHEFMMKIKMDGDIIESTGLIFDRERIKKLWLKIREIVLERDTVNLKLHEISQKEFVDHIEEENFFQLFGNPAIINCDNGQRLVCMAWSMAERFMRITGCGDEADEVIRRAAEMEG